MDTYDENFDSEKYNEGFPNPADFVITKFVARGIDKLSLEDLAVTLVIPDFATSFKKRTGSEWNSRLQVKVIERLTKANFDIQWMTRKTSEPNHPFFVACSRGDIDRAIEFIRKSNEDLRYAIDPSLKTGLHFAARDGHISLVEILIQRGFNVNARDRTLKTPLHYACLQGHETIADVLLKNKADIMAKDVSGRTAFHFACCGTSSRLITLLLGTKPELVNMTDNVGRTGLHYAVWNASQRQVDIIRSVIENKGDVNAQDDDGKTPLHHASEGGRARAIPILLQKGADITIREQKNGRTPLDLAPNDNIRQLIVVYSAPPFRVKDDDMKWLDQAVRGEKPGKSTSDKNKGIIKSVVEKPPEDKMIIASFLRDKLFGLMKDIQEYGVQNAQHIKRPYIFTASWMEGVATVEDFFDKISAISALEASIRIFNVFFPYDKPYPEPKGGEPIMSSFYGDVWNFDALIAKDTTVQTQTMKKRDTEEMERMNQALDTSNRKLEDKEYEIAKFKKENEVLRKQIEDFNTTLAKAKLAEKTAMDLKRQAGAKDSEIIALNAKIRELNLQLDEKHIELEAMQQNQVDENVQQELDKALDRIVELEKEITTIKEREKAIRFKSGQIFLSALQSRGPKKPDAAEKNTDLNFRDDRVILKMYKALKNNPPSLEERLKEQDKDGDGKLNEAEFTKVFAKLNIVPKDILSLSRVAGFYSGKQLVGIQEFIKILEERPKLREKWEEELFFRLVEHFWENDIDIENAFKIMDTSGDGVLNMVELQEGLAKFDLKINDKDAFSLFDIFDTSDDGVVQLEEFKTVLKEYEKLRQKQIGVPSKQKPAEDIVLKGELVPTGDYMLIHGELKVQIPSSKGIDAKSSPLYLKFYLLGASISKIVRKVQLTQEPDGTVSWGVAIKIPVVLILKENIYDHVWIKLFNKEDQEDELSYLGEINVPWKECIEAPPDKWPINSEYALANRSFPTKAVKGSLLIQAKWVPSTSATFKSSNIQRKEILPKFLSPISDEGFLEVFLITTFNCWYHEEVYCDVILPDKTKKTFKAKFNEKEDAYWNERFNVELKVSKDSTLSNMECVVYNKSGKMNIMVTLQLDWEECLKFPGETNPNQTYVVGNVPGTGKFCKLYIRTKWIPRNSPLGEKIVEETKQKGKTQQQKAAIPPEDLEKGLIKINIVRAKGLLVADFKTSDPFCKVIFKGAETVGDQTQVVKNSLTPQWSHPGQLNISFLKNSVVPLLEFEIYDWDIDINDLIGTLKVDWTSAFKNPLTWAINKYYKLENPDPKKYKNKDYFGEIYIQIYYVPAGQFDPNVKPDDIDVSLEEKAAQKNKIKGSIVMQVVHAKNITAGPKGKALDPFAFVTFPNGKSVESDSAKNTLNPIWKKRIDMQIEIEKQNMKPITVEVKDTRFLGDKALSYVYIPWDDCVAKPGTWAINKVFQLNPSAELNAQYKIQNAGDIYVQVKFLEEGMVDDGKEAEVLEDIGISGTLFVNVIFGKGLRIADSNSSSSDPYCEIHLPDKHVAKTRTIKDDLNPVWNFKEKFPLKIPIENYKDIEFKVFDDDGPLMTSDILGNVKISWMECFKNPSQWLVNELYELTGPEDIKRDKNIISFGHIYVQMKFLKEGMADSGPEPDVKFNLDAYIKEQQEKLKDTVIGKLFVNVIFAKGLVSEEKDIADPFCRIVFPNGKSVKSETITDNPNPKWNFKSDILLNLMRKAGTLPPIKIDVWDYDSFLDRNDLLGYVQIEWEQCIQQTGKWSINKALPLQAPPETTLVPESGNWGQVYVQVKFVKEGTDIGESEAPVLVDLEKAIQEESQPIEGQLSIRIIHAKGLPVTDSLAEGGKSDPYVRVILPDGKAYETDPSPNNLNPLWNHKQDLEMAIPKNKVKAIMFEVWDKDKYTPSDKVGQVKVSMQECIDNSGKWHINNTYKIEPVKPVKEGQAPPDLGELYVQVRFAKKGETADPKEPKLIEDLKTFLEHEEALFEGQLKINIPHAKNLYPNDGATSDPFCKIFLPGGVKLEVPHLKKTLTPLWDYKASAPLSVPKNRATTLKVEVWDHDIGFNDCIGVLELPLLDILMAPGKWSNNGLYDLKIPPKMAPEKALKGLGQIYLQVKFISKDIVDDGVDAPVTDNIKAQIEKNQEKIEGHFRINVIHGKSLLPVENNASTSDPFVKISFAEQTIESPPLQKTLNPIWNFKNKIIPVSVFKNKELPPLVINVFDHNTIMKNTLIGLKEIKTDELIANPGKWQINKGLSLTGPQHLIQKYGPAAFGEVYFQAKFVPKGAQDDEAEPEVTENLEAILQKEKELTKGDLKFNVIHAKNLTREDKKNLEIEALCKVKIPTIKDMVSSERAAKGDKPLWDFKKQFSIAVPQNNNEDIRVEVYHYRIWPLTNELLGYLDINFKEILSKPGEWSINKSYKLTGPSNLVKKPEFNEGFGDIYIQAKFTKEEQPDDGTAPPVTENLQEIIAKDQGAVKGTLKVIIVHIKKLLPERKLDPYVKILLDNKVVGKTDPKDQNNNPIWKETEFPIPLSLTNQTLKTSEIHFQVRDKNFMIDDSIAFLKVPTREVVELAGKWYDKIHKLDSSEKILLQAGASGVGEMYIQMKFIKEGTNDDGVKPGLKEDLEAILLQENQPIKGKLKVYCIHAKDVIASDSGFEGSLSDPFCRITFPSGETLKTAVVNQKTTAIWKEVLITKEFSIPKIAIQPLKIEILDSDKFSGGDALGFVNVDWRICIQKPGQWAIDEIRKIDGPPDLIKSGKYPNGFGELYFQIQFLPVGMNDLGTLPLLKQDLGEPNAKKKK